MIIDFALWLAAYLIGSIPFGWLIARLKGVDIFAAGSGNIGATNVARVLGKPLGLLVFVLDFAKGAMPTLLAFPLHAVLTDDPPLGPPHLLEVGAGMAAFLGHLFPIYLRFRGGKGVATAAGVVTVLFPLPALAGLLAFIAVTSATRFVSLGSLAAATALVALYLLRSGLDFASPLTIFALVALVLVFVKHRGNIARLRNGIEAQVGSHRAVEASARSLHVLSLAMWMGMGIFFSFVVALPLFQNFDSLGQMPPENRPEWFPLPPAYQLVDAAAKIDGPREQGSRAAGFVVSFIFPNYFLIQFLCGVAAFGTALGWPKLRPWLLGIALVSVLVAWPLERKVAELRESRNAATDSYLLADPEKRDRLRNDTLAIRADFIRWHLASLFLNLGTIALVTTATAMAGNLPPWTKS